MAYTNAWTDNVPLGSEAAKNIDDFMRRVRLDIHERMDNVVADWTADPVVPLAAGTFKIVIPASGFQGLQADTSSWFEGGATGAWVISDDYPIPVTSGSRSVAAPISGLIPAGRTITQIEWLINRNTAPTFTASLISITFDLAQTIAVEHTISTSVGGLQLLDSGAISITLDNAKYYSLNADIGIVGGNTAFLFAARVTVG